MVIELVGFEKLSLDGFVMENYCWLLFVGSEKRVSLFPFFCSYIDVYVHSMLAFLRQSV